MKEEHNAPLFYLRRNDMPKFKPNFLLDEQMYFDAQTSLLFQIREELKDLNKNIRKLTEKEAIQEPEKKGK